MRNPALALILLPLLIPSACGEPVQDDHFARDVREARADAPPVTSQAVPVRVGELGPNFPACNAAGTTRNLGAGQGLTVRAAPFETAEATGAVAAAARFYVCSRSHDQKWFGIVYDEGGAPQNCGVSAPLPARRNYEGPCKAGWVQSPFVKLTARAESPQPADSPA